MSMPRDWAKALPIKRLPDGHQFERPATIGGVAIGLPAESLKVNIPFSAAASDGLTDEQRAIQKAGQHLAVLMRDKAFEDVIKSMISFRQAYAVAYRELEERVTKYVETKGEAIVGLDNFAVQYAMYEAGKPFSEHVLMRGIIDHVLPWLTTVVDQHTQDDENEAVLERKRLDEERRAKPLTVGFSHSVNQDVMGTMTRDKSLVLVGWKPAIRFILNHAEDAAVKAGHQVISLTTKDRITAGDQAHNIVRVALPVWKGCADERKGIAMVMGKEAADKMGALPDLVVCHDLEAAYVGQLSFATPVGVCAGRGHKAFRRWCDGAGAGFLAGVCLPAQDGFDPAHPAWEQLKTFARLVPVTVKEDEQAVNGKGYILTIGNNADGMSVSEAALARYEGPEIIVPGGIK